MAIRSRRIFTSLVKVAVGRHCTMFSLALAFCGIFFSIFTIRQARFNIGYEIFNARISRDPDALLSANGVRLAIEKAGFSMGSTTPYNMIFYPRKHNLGLWSSQADEFFDQSSQVATVVQQESDRWIAENMRSYKGHSIPLLGMGAVNAVGLSGWSEFLQQTIDCLQQQLPDGQPSDGQYTYQRAFIEAKSAMDGMHLASANSSTLDAFRCSNLIHAFSNYVCFKNNSGLIDSSDQNMLLRHISQNSSDGTILEGIRFVMRLDFDHWTGENAEYVARLRSSIIPTAFRQVGLGSPQMTSRGQCSSTGNICLAIQGISMTNVDSVANILERFPYVVIIMSVIACLFLLLVYQSAPAALLACVALMFVMGVSFSSAIYIWQYGLVSHDPYSIFGSTNGLSWAVFVMGFCVAFGLGLDYDIFLLTRIQEARREGYSQLASVQSGVVKSGEVISIAGLIMLIGFLSCFLFTSSTLSNQGGFVLALNVMLDCFFVRLFLVPGVLVLGGDLMWWPGQVSPVLHSFEVDDLKDF